jgi:hypothetical protein
MSRPTNAGAVWGGLLASLAAHLVLALELGRRPPSPPPPKSPAIVELELVKPPPPRPRPAQAPPPPVQRPKPSPSAARRTPPTPAQAAPSPAVATAPVPAPDAPTSLDAPSPPVDLRAAGQAAADRAGDLIVVQPAPGPEPERQITAPERLDDANERTQHLIAERLGQDRVQRGMIDPYFTQLGHALSRSWRPPTHVTRDSLVDNTAQLGEDALIGLKAWQKVAERYGKTGRPVDSDVPRDDPLNPLQEWGALREQLLAQYRQVNQTVVRITQGAAGQLLHAELVQASQDPELDALVLRELRAGEMQLPRPPDSGLGISKVIRSVWAFQLVISISPPHPAAVVTGSFDPLDGELDVRVPLDRRVYKYVQLLSVE